MRTVVLPAYVGQGAGWLLALTLPFALLLAGSNLVQAANPHLQASGGFVQTSFEQSNIRSSGGVTRFDFVEHDTLSGTLTGTSVIRGSCVVRASGYGVCRAFETFTGTVEGESGTARFHDVIFLNLTTGAAHGTFTVVSGTADLANLHGHGTFEGTGGAGTYAGQLLFAP
jgi:hypothetical protein